MGSSFSSLAMLFLVLSRVDEAIGNLGGHLGVGGTRRQSCELPFLGR